jgi:CheY-like chemotaxis protein
VQSAIPCTDPSLGPLTDQRRHLAPTSDRRLARTTVSASADFRLAPRNPLDASGNALALARIVTMRPVCRIRAFKMAQVNTMQTGVTTIPYVPSPSPAASSPRRGAILVVEDREDVRQGMSQLLELHGFLVVDAAQGEQALEHLRSDPPGFAVILLDLMMPGPLNGCDFRSRQLALPELADIPTIVVSAADMDPALRAQLRPDAWVEKPFRFDQLLALVKKYVTPEAGALISE